jgi:hypothetical protein
VRLLFCELTRLGIEVELRDLGQSGRGRHDLRPDRFVLSAHDHQVERSVERLVRVDLVAALGVEDPVADERLRLSSVLGVVNPDLDVLLGGAALLRLVREDFALAPADDLIEVRLANAHRLDV